MVKNVRVKNHKISGLTILTQPMVPSNGKT